MSKKAKITLAVVLFLIAAISIAVIAFAFFADTGKGISIAEGLVLGAALADLNERDPLEADATVTIDLLSLQFDKDLKIYRWNTEGDPIFAVDYGFGKSYFSGEKTTDENGNIIATSDVRKISLEELLAAIAYIHGKGGFDGEFKNNKCICKMDLDKETMEKMVNYIAPEASEHDIYFTSGTAIVTVKNMRVESIKITVNGEIDALITTLDVSIGTTLRFTDNKCKEKLPDEVLKALTE
jgi:hypothetical protein